MYTHENAVLKLKRAQMDLLNIKAKQPALSPINREHLLAKSSLLALQIKEIEYRIIAPRLQA